MKKKSHKPTKLFENFGVKFKGESGDQKYARCIFCNYKKPTFYCNPVEITWDCKYCGQSGGYESFLKAIHKQAEKKTKKNDLEKLIQEKKGLNMKILKQFKIVYDDNTDSYLIPIWNESKHMVDIIKYKLGKKLPISAPGSKKVLYNIWSLPDHYTTIYLVEGLWDTMIMDYIIGKLDIKHTIAIGSPGATTFKIEWVNLFKNKNVNIIYDNDHDKIINEKIIVGAGKLGQKKVKNYLGGVAKKLLYVNWKDKYGDKFDVRDLYNLRNQNVKKTYKLINMYLKSEPMPVKAPKEYMKQIETERPLSGPSGRGMHFEDVYKNYRKWLLLPDIRPLDALYATVIANRFNENKNPVWCLLVGPSGGAKTAILESLNEAYAIHPLSSLTSKTLISGKPGFDGRSASLAQRLDGKVLAIKDFTVILKMPEQEFIQIMSTLRDLYDGTALNEYGNGLTVDVKSTFGIVAGVTPVIDDALAGNSALGERFTCFYFPVVDSKELKKQIGMRSIDNSLSKFKAEMRDSLTATASKVLDYDFGSQPTISQKYKEILYEYALFTSIMRGSIDRDNYTKQMKSRPQIEEPNRLIQQFGKFATGGAAFKYRTRVTQDEMNLAYNMMMSSIHYLRNTIVKYIYENNKNEVIAADDVYRVIRLPKHMIDLTLDDLRYLNVLRLTNSGRQEYKLSKSIKETIKNGKIYKEK